MELIPGKEYTCRNGKKAVIEADVQEFDPVYPFQGKVLNLDGSMDRIAFWMYGGRYKTNGTSEYDIIC